MLSPILDGCHVVQTRPNFVHMWHRSGHENLLTWGFCIPLPPRTPGKQPPTEMPGKGFAVKPVVSASACMTASRVCTAGLSVPKSFTANVQNSSPAPSADGDKWGCEPVPGRRSGTRGDDTWEARRR